MQLNENIQFHRKRLSLSQEELGKMLFVSRQTVSMWEKGQTIPSVDNLVRLGEIFSISVDELLKGETPEAASTEAQAKETYTQQFSEEEVTGICKSLYGGRYKRNIWLLIGMMLMLIASVISGAEDIVIGFIIMLTVLVSATVIGAYRVYRKILHEFVPRVSASAYQYEMCADGFYASVFREEECVLKSKVRFDDITRMQQMGDITLLVIGRIFYMIRQAEVEQGVILRTYMMTHPEKVKKMRPQNAWTRASLALFIMSLISIFGALWLWSLLDSAMGNPVGPVNSWACFPMTVLPISSVVFGIVAWRRGHKFKKNLIAGIIMTIVLCIYGSFVFIF